MIWQLILLAAFASCGWMALAEASEPILILNATNESQELPRHFRRADSPFQGQANPLPSSLGLRELRLSGSAQFSKGELAALYKQLGHPKPFVVIDLRQECHGFINGNAVSWYAPRDWANLGKTRQEVIEKERGLLGKLKGVPEVVAQKVIEKSSDGAIEKTQSVILQTQVVQMEEELVKANGGSYLRIPVTDHLPPSKEAIEQFLAFYRQLPSKAWIHFHCAGGDGRTTTFMSIVDMLHNAARVSFHDIIERQHLIGGSDLQNDTASDARWKSDATHERIAFLRAFYAEAKENSNPAKTSSSNESKPY